MKTVDPQQLKPVPQEEIVMFARLARALVTNLRVYPPGHAIVKDVAGRVCKTVASISEKAGTVLVGSEESLLTINRDSIYKACPEQEYSIMLSSWFRERGIRNLLLESRLGPEELLRIFGWLHKIEVGECRRALESGLSRIEQELQLDAVALNVKAPKSDKEIRETLEAMDLAPILEKAGVAASGSFPSLEDMELDTEALAEAVRESMQEVPLDLSRAQGRLSMDSIDWAQADASALHTLAERVAAVGGGGPQVDKAAIQEEIARTAQEAVRRMIPEAISGYLASAAPQGEAAQRVRADVLGELREDHGKQANVVVELAGRLASEADPGAAASCMRAIEDLVPGALESGHRREAARAISALLTMTSSQRPRDLAGRADASLRYVAAPRTVKNLLHQLQAGPEDERGAVAEMLAALGRWSVTTLMEELRNSMSRATRLAIVDILVHAGRRAQQDGDDVEGRLQPLLREIDRWKDNPWYFTRNLVQILSDVGAPAFRHRIAEILQSDVDPRVRGEIVKGLMRSDTEAARRLARDTVVSGRLKDPSALAETIPWLMRHDPLELLAALERMVADKDVTHEIADGVLCGLALCGGNQALTVLDRVLGERAGLLRRPAFAEPARVGAVEGLGVLGMPEARKRLEEARQDPSNAVRRRAAELMAVDPEEAERQARQRLGLAAERAR
jgi:HEAT repeat protein